MFNYEKFYKERMEERQSSGLYREFKKLHPGKGHYPHAFDPTCPAKDFTVWCGNDYLGMSNHPKVKDAMM